MSTIENFIFELQQRAIHLELDGQDLKIKGPKEALTPAIRITLKERKAELIQYFSSADQGKMDYSLFFFSSDDTVFPQDKYKLVLDATRFADQAGFSGVWTPERHFHPMGGLFPNPAVMMAGLATITEKIKLRCGSVVLPLHDPLRIAEEWAVVDNLSAGRVEMSFASGWHVDDFVFQPQNYAQRRDLMFSGIETIKQLWRGETLERQGGGGQITAVQTRPRPIQPEIPVWVTAIGNPDSYQKTGAMGAHLLTCLLDQEMDELAEKIKLYRQTLRAHGFDPRSRKVGVFLHTYVGEEGEDIRETVHDAFMSYLQGTLHLLGRLGRHAGLELDPSAMDEEDKHTLLEFAFERYLEGRTLIGTPETCQQRIKQLLEIDVDEVACLVDWGLSYEQVMASLRRLSQFV